MNITKFMNLKMLIEHIRFRFDSMAQITFSRAKKKKKEELTVYKWSYSFLPKNVSQLIFLKKLNFWELNYFPIELTSIKNLEELSIGFGSIKEIPSEIERLTNLRYLDIGHLQLKELPESIVNLHKLEHIILDENDFDEIPEVLFQMKSLKSLSLVNNSINQISAKIGELVSLENLELSKNNITSIPIEIGRLINLKSIRLDDNKLRAIPKEAISSMKLLTISLRDNPFDDLPEIRDLGLLELKDFFDLNDSFKYIINLNEIFKTPFQQYLLFFKDFVKSAKGKDVYFEVERISQGLLLKIKVTEEVTLDTIQSYLSEYMNFAQDKVVKNINIEHQIKQIELEALIKNLQLQIENLNKQIKNKDWQLKFLNEDNQDSRLEKIKMLNIIENFSQDKKRITDNNKDTNISKLKEEFRSLVKANNYPLLFKMLENHLSNSDTLIINDITILQQKWNLNIKNEYLGILNSEDIAVERSKITKGIIEIIDLIK